MITLKTQKALAILHDIASGRCSRMKNYEINEKELNQLLDKLCQMNIIHLRPGKPLHNFFSYQLNRPLSKISLLNVLEATGEHLNCNNPVTESFYERYGAVDQKLGIVNQMTRSVCP